VYYKVDGAQHITLVPVVYAFQQQVLHLWPGLSCELMQRPKASGEAKETWMEIYRHADQLTDQMIDSIERLAQTMQLPAPRMSEIFVPLR
jgi:hypothetical protein